MTAAALLILADRIGVFVFALSGGILGVRKNMDLFGVVFLAFLPAIGGGTLRDLLLDQPVFWLKDEVNLLIAGTGGLTAFVLPVVVENFKPLRWADAAGLALFAVTGAAKATALGYGVGVVAIMGVMTATAGGLLRDVVANRSPLLLRTEIYATAALAGSLVYFFAYQSPMAARWAFAAGLATAFSLRGIAIVFNLSLPRPPRKKVD